MNRFEGPVACPVCGAIAKPHCNIAGCGWARCTSQLCRSYGYIDLRHPWWQLTMPPAP